MAVEVYYTLGLYFSDLTIVSLCIMCYVERCIFFPKSLQRGLNDLKMKTFYD